MEKKLKNLAFLYEMRKCYLNGTHKKNRYTLGRKYRVGNVPMWLIEKWIKNEITDESVDGFIKECREYRKNQKASVKPQPTHPQPNLFSTNNDGKEDNISEAIELMKLMLGVLTMSKDEFKTIAPYLRERFGTCVYDFIAYTKS